MLPSIPPRDNRVLQTAKALRAIIIEGGFQEGLPGEASLAKQLRVSRVSLRKALAILEVEGMIAPTSRGSRRKIIYQSLEEANSLSDEALGADLLRGKTVTTVSPFLREKLPLVVTLEHARLQALCADVGITLQFAHADLSRTHKPDYRLSEFVKKYPSDIYLLLLSTQETQLWFAQQGIPTLVQGTTWPGNSLACVDVDQKAIGVHAAQMLSRLGHQRVGFLSPTPRKQGMILFEEGFDNAGGIDMIKAEQDDSAESVLKAVQSLVHDKYPPTTLVLPRIPYVLTAATYLMSQGLRIPQDICLLSLVHDRFFEYYYPTIAGYRVDSGKVSQTLFAAIKEMLRYPEIRMTRQTLLMPDFMPGQSLATRKPN